MPYDLAHLPTVQHFVFEYFPIASLCTLRIARVVMANNTSILTPLFLGFA